MRGVANALIFLHGSTPPIVHGDIKGVRSKILLETRYSSLPISQANVLVNDAGEACLSDIGISKIPFPLDWTQPFGTRSARWMAPELIAPNDDGADDYPVTRQTDVYSFSMTVIEVCPKRIDFDRLFLTFIIPDSYWPFTVLASATRFHGGARCVPRSASKSTFES